MPAIGKCGGGVNQHKQLVTKQQRVTTTTTIPLPEQLLKQPNKSEGESQGKQDHNRQADKSTSAIGTGGGIGQSHGRFFPRKYQLVTKQQQQAATMTTTKPQLKQSNKSEGESQGVQANNGQVGGEEVADDLCCSIM